MSTELAMNAYVLLGNALNYVLNAPALNPEAGFDPCSLRDLYGKIEPLPPARILEAVAALSPQERNTLGHVCRYVVVETTSGETETILGLPREVIDQTLADLDV
jgi:hypothetical protein